MVSALLQTEAVRLTLALGPRLMTAPTLHKPRQGGRCLSAPLATTKRRHRRAASAASSEQPAAGRNILVAVDGSEDSRWALRWTADELHRPGDTVHVAHCVPTLPVTGGMYAVPDRRLAMIDVDRLLASEEQYMLAEAHLLRRMCDEAFQQQQVAHVVDLLREDPLGSGDKGRIADALCSKAEALQAAALVVASQTRSGLAEFVLGSVAAHCAAHSCRPVLVLHAPRSLPEDKEGLLGRLASAAARALGGGEEAPDAAGAGGEPLPTAYSPAEEQPGPRGSRNIVLAVDDSEASELACGWAMAHLYRPGDSFYLMRVIPTLPFRAAYAGPELDGAALYSPGGQDLTDSFKSAAERYVQHRFEPKLQAAGVPYRVEIVVEPTDDSVAGVGDAICRRAEELHAAAVVLGSHMRGGLLQFLLGSVATHVAQHCRQPVAVLH